MNISERCNMACFILGETRDGEELHPRHLKLVEMAVNGLLNDEGIMEFCQLYHNVRKGYEKPYFHGIEHLSIDHEGFIYWKGQHVEHYNQPWAFSEEARGQAEKLAGICQELEREGQQVTAGAVMRKF